MPVYRFTLAGSAPRTKKNSPTIATFGRHQRAVLVPSEAFRNWAKDVLTLRPIIHAKVTGLPIAEPCHIAALVYRDAETGDWTGYVDAIADVIQADVWQCQGTDCRKKMTTHRAPAVCEHCFGRVLKRTRQGLGIILDDRQIQHWDGSRLRKDSARPRVELTITTIADPQKDLFA